jgi:hypothetical protein
MKSDLHVYTPAELVKTEIQDCLSLIKEGGALINSKTAANEFPHSAAIAIKRVEERIVGVGIIKQKRPQYASDIIKKADSNLTAISTNLAMLLLKNLIGGLASHMRSP